MLTYVIVASVILFFLGFFILLLADMKSLILIPALLWSFCVGIPWLGNAIRIEDIKDRNERNVRLVECLAKTDDSKWCVDNLSL